MASLLERLFGLHKIYKHLPVEEPSPPVLPTPDTRPPPRASRADALPPLKSWCHPFKDKRDPLAQLTHMANANAGYYPLGRSGLWHGGVHFDSGTAGILEQSSVHCLADGEVVAYRIDTRSPTTRYFLHELTVDKPFSRNFVLVRHHLQPPKIDGSPDTPPSLIFYSLYMHLQDWAVYRDDPAVPRPTFWPEAQTVRVKQTVNDTSPDHPNQPGVKVRNKDWQGQVLDFLPRGAEITVSGTGSHRKLESSPGPTQLVTAEGALAGYIAASLLQPVTGNQHRITSSRTRVNVRAWPHIPSDILCELPTGTVVTVSGEGDFRKLEHVNQYVPYDSLEVGLEPLAVDRVMVLDQPVPIKAGALVGYLGDYQDSGADRPEQKLHLEVFSGEYVAQFMAASRAWSERLPEREKNWLKIAKGTAVVPHQAHFSASRLPILERDNPLSAADLLIPKSLLDGLSAADKISLPATSGRGACNWYRLERLLHDRENNLLDGWVREDVGITPWVSPWSWEGHKVLIDYSRPHHAMASFLSAVDRFSDTQRERFRPFAEYDDKGPLKSCLYDIIDENRNGKMTAVELQSALQVPAQAQAISQLILYKESEWYYEAKKWDELDELLGHSGSTPHLNWLAEKQRIREMTWWNEVADKVGLASWGKAYHFHPVGFVASFIGKHELISTEDFLRHYEQAHKLFAPGTPTITASSMNNLKRLIVAMNNYYELSGMSANLYEVSYMLATVRHETYYYPTGEYFSEKPEIGALSYFNKYDPVLAPTPELRMAAMNNGNMSEGDGYKYRGRGCVHLTWKSNYRKFSSLLSFDFVSDPDAAGKFEQSVPIMIVGMTKGVFTGKKIRDYLNADGIDYLSARRVINSTDKKELIASYAEIFESILLKSSRLSKDFK